MVTRSHTTEPSQGNRYHGDIKGRGLSKSNDPHHTTGVELGQSVQWEQQADVGTGQSSQGAIGSMHHHRSTNDVQRISVLWEEWQQQVDIQEPCHSIGHVQHTPFAREVAHFTQFRSLGATAEAVVTSRLDPQGVIVVPSCSTVVAESRLDVHMPIVATGVDQSVNSIEVRKHSCRVAIVT